MSTRTPDRWTRLVLKQLRDEDTQGELACLLTPQEVVKLLRAEHRWAVKMVRKHFYLAEEARAREQHDGRDDTAFGWECRRAQCQQILDKMNARAK